MRTARMATLAALAALLPLTMACCTTTEKKPEVWGGVTVDQSKLTAVVENVDPETRQVTMKTDKGETQTIVCGPEVRNFAQIRKGDKVTVDYRESVTIMAMSGVKAGPEGSETTDVVGAPLGQKPAGTIVKTAEVLAEVTAIDHAKRMVSLKGPARTVTVQVPQEYQGLSRLRKGDKVYMRTTVALAIAVTAQ